MGGADQSEMFRSMFEVWFSMAETMFSNAWGFTRQAGQTVADAVRDEPQDALVFSVQPGAVASGRLWLKNQSADPLPLVEFRCTRPETATGVELDATVVTCAPGSISDVEPGASMQIDVEVDAPANAEPGTYHALLLVRQLPATCRPIQIDVEAG